MEMFDEDLFQKIYDVAFKEMKENFKEPGVYMALLATFGKEKTELFLNTWEKI